MRNVALDLGNRITYAEVRDGKVVRRTAAHSIEGLKDLLGPDTAPAAVAFEACREAWHIHDVLLEWGHQPVLLDTTRVKQLGIGQHQRKNDRIDAETMALAVEKGMLPKAHVLSPHRRQLRELLGLRRNLTEARAALVTELRGVLRAEGVRVPYCQVGRFPKIARQSCPAEYLETLEPLLELVEQQSRLIEDFTVKLEVVAQKEPAIALLRTAPGVGVVVSAGFVSVIDKPQRFKTAHQVEAYLGLVPSEHTSGARKLGSITKQGNSYLRANLVQAAWCIIRSRNTHPLKTWALSVSRRRGKSVAVVALARRLAGVLWAMWRDGTAYEGERVGRSSAKGLEQNASQTLAVVQALKRTPQNKESMEAALKRAERKVPFVIRNRVKELSSKNAK